MQHVEKLQKILDVSGLTQEQLAFKLGVTFSSVNAWMNGRSTPRRSALLMIDATYAEVVDQSLLDAKQFSKIIEREGGTDCRLSSQQVEALLEGMGDEMAIAVLRGAQHSKFLSRLTAIIALLPDGKMSDGLALLDTARRKNPERCKEALTRPHTAVWASALLQELSKSSAGPDVDRHVEHFNSIAVAIAWSCGVSEFEISVPIQASGSLVLPGLGVVKLDKALPDHAYVRCEGGRLTFEVPSMSATLPADLTENDDYWHAMSTIVSSCEGISLKVEIDDIDPYRLHDTSLNFVPDGPQLSEVEVKNWNETVDRAWEIIVENLPDFARSISAGMSVIVPIQHASINYSAFQREGFGALISTRPTAPELAGILIEEFQRMKLNALHSLIPLHEADDSNLRYCMPWSDAPLSYHGVAEGLYSTVATAEFWSHRHSGTDGNERIEAELNACQRNVWAECAAYELAEFDRLTPFGHALVEKVYGRHEKLYLQAAEDLENLVSPTVLEHRISFRLRNVVPDQQDVTRLARAWRAMLPAPVDRMVHQRIEVGMPSLSGRFRRRKLRLLRLVDPGVFAELLEGSSALLEIVAPYATSTDVLLAAGRYEEALQQYSTAIRADSNDMEAWAGLAVAAAQIGGPAASTLGRVPELVVALYREVQPTQWRIVDPLRLAEWLECLLAQIQDFPET